MLVTFDKTALIKKYLEKFEQEADPVAGDTEAVHGVVDSIICELLDELGFNEIVGKYDSYNKWYA